MVLLYIKAAFIFTTLFTFVLITKPEVVKQLILIVFNKVSLKSNSNTFKNLEK